MSKPKLVHSLPLLITTDSNGDGSTTFQFNRDTIVHDVIAHKEGSIDRREFFRLVWYGRRADTTDQVSEGQESSGGSGPGNGYFKSSIIPGGSELYIAIQAGVDNATSNYKIAVVFEVIP